MTNNTEFFKHYDGTIPAAAEAAVRALGAPEVDAEGARERYAQVESTIVQMHELLRAIEESGKMFLEHAASIERVLRTADPNDPAAAGLAEHLRGLLPALEKIASDRAQVEKNLRDLLAIPQPGQQFPYDPTRLQ